MDESEENMSAEDTQMEDKAPTVKVKPKKRSLVERELETTLTARITSPAVSGDESSTSRYGRARRLKTNTDFCDTDKAVMKVLKSPQFDKTPVKSPSSPVYKMHASNSPANNESLKKVSVDNNLENQIEYIYNANISLSRFGSEEKTSPPVPTGMKKLKVYIRKDLIQTKEKDEEVTLIKNMFSPAKSSRKKSNSHLSNVLERSSEKYNINGNIGNVTKLQNGYSNTSVVKALDFDSNKKKKGDSRRDSKESKLVVSKNELFEMEAACTYQVGDLAWARMGTYPFWPCIVTREPGSELFVKKKMFGRIERDLIHVTFFGDNGRRSWILDSMLRKFLGLTEFETARDEFPAELKKKDPKLYGAFFISDKKLALWHISIEEAEILQREPKRLRVDILNDMLGRSKPKFTPKSHKSSKVTRTDSDVSLSESLYDTLFSEDDGKNDDLDRSRNKTRNKSLDVSEVVTACLDNMAAKTGMTKIQRQSHMDRWLQKAKSKTPEKSHVNISVTVEKIDKDEKEKVKAKENSNSKSKKRKSFAKEVVTNKPYSLRRSGQESQNLFSHQNEHDYSKTVTETAPNTETADIICVIDKVESLSEAATKQANKTVEEISHDIEVTANGYPSDSSEQANHTTGDCSALENNTIANIESSNNEIRNICSIETNPTLNSISEEKVSDEVEGQDSVSNMDTDTAYTETEYQDTQSELDSHDTSSPVTNNETESQDTTKDLLKANGDKTVDTKKKYLRRSLTDADDTNETVLNNVETETRNTQESASQSEIESDDINESLPRIIQSASQGTNESLFKDDTLESEGTEDSYLKKTQISDIHDTNNSVSTVYTESQDTDDDSVFENDETEPNVSEITTETDTQNAVQTGSSQLSEEQSQPMAEQETTIEKKEQNITESERDDNMSVDEYSTDFEMSQDKEEFSLGENKDCDNNDSPTIITSTAAKVSEPIESDEKIENGNEVVSNKIVAISSNVNDSNNDVLLKAIDELIEEKETTISVNEVAQKPDSGVLVEIVEKTAQLPVTDSYEREDRIAAESDDVVNQIDGTLDETHINNKEIAYNESNTQLDDNISLTSDSVSDKISNENGQSIKQLDSDVVSISSMSIITSVSSEMLPKILTVASLNDKVNGGITNEHLLSIKQQLLLDSDNESMSSQDEIPLCELKRRSQRNISKPNVFKEDTTDSCTSNTSSRKLSVVLTDCVTTQTKLTERKDATSKLDEVIDISEKSPDTGKAKKHKLRLQKSETPPKPKINGISESKETSPEPQVKQEKDLDTISINSSDSGTSIKRRGKQPAYETMKEPEFLEYVELKRDTLMDEHPELTGEEIMAYLYKTWQYKESKKSDIAKTDDIEQINLVKGVNGSHEQHKKRVVSKPKAKKLIDIAKIMNNQPKTFADIDNVKPRALPKRKTSKPFYKEEFSDIEEEIELFEIFKTAKSNKVPKSETPKENIKAENVKIKSEETDNKVKLEVPVIEDKIETKEEIKISDEEEYEQYFDEEELYFEQLTKPKPNIFKGLVREKVCEICEKTTNLVKCKGCSGMFHVECVKKVVEVVEVPPPTRGRKKKKKPRGRRPKNSTDSNGDDSHSDDKSHDPNVSEENVSMEEAKDSEPIVIVDVDNFEAQLTAKMQEMIETANTIEYDSYSSNDGLDWSDTVAGKCKIVDIKLKQKPVPTTVDYSDFKCKNCQQYDIPICFVCKSAVSPKGKVEKRQKCQVAHCHKYFHVECLDHWPQTQFTTSLETARNKKTDEQFEALTCPRHVCHTCVCDDPRGCKTRFSGDKLARCVRCPATYHSFTKCLPAGSQILSASHIVCPRHYEHRPGKVPCHVNTGWCFICALGGTLICCEYCPTSFHADCLNIEPPEGGYMCEDCETGRLPLYGEMVWVKLGHYRWWPGIVLHPSEIPDNIMAVKHTPGEFVVRFFGQYDHYWVNRGRVFPFQEGDSGRISGQKSKINEAFTKAMEHAQRAFEILKNVEPNDEENQDIASSLLPPHYVKLKVNRPCGSLYGKKIDIEESSLTQCECNPDEEDPCGPYSHCLNRMLLTECGPTCRAGERCQNRQFEKRQYPKLVPYRTPHRGWGLKTLEDIRAGQFVIEYVGELIDEEEFRRRMRRKHEIRDENFYFLTLDKERMIDAGPKGNLARFMNHCCEPNCETQKWTVLGDVRVGLFAINDIPANTEVTFNYNLECAGIEKKACMCGAKRCSGYIGAKPKQDEPQPKKTKLPVKRTYKKRKSNVESPSTSKTKPKRPVGRPCKPRELTEIEKDLLIIKNATNGLSSDSEGSGRLSSMESERKDTKALKRKRVSFSTEEIIIYDGTNSPSVKRVKLDDEKDKVSDVDNIV